ncbi:MAG: TonB-dependent receptor [Tannerella sp.]|jgi:outer membrane receptor protein involved in Fe transport|nr:TonB-dependent receptor [Tannerella sp.]
MFRTKLYLLFVGVVAMLNVQDMFSQTTLCNLSGKVVDNADNQPVEYANVILYNATDTTPAGYTVTDASGAFALECKTAGKYYVSVSYIGYKSFKTKPVAVTAAQKSITLPEIRMEEENAELSEVVVVGRKRQIVYKLDRQVIEAAGYLSAAGGTAVDILTQTPSIRVDAEGEVSFRGSSGFKVYIDGKPGTLDGTAALEQIPAGQIENIEILTTPSARNDADGAVGIININTKKSNIEGWSGMVNTMGSSVLSRNLDFLLALKKPDFRWQLSGEASRRFVLSDFDQTKTVTTPEMTTIDHSTGDRTRHTAVYYLRSQFDWLRDNTTWTAALTGGYRDRWRGGELHYEDSYTTAEGERSTGSFNGKDFVHLYEYNLRGDAGVEHNFTGRKGHKLTSSVYALYEGDAMENFQTDLWDMQGAQVQGHRAWEFEYRFEAQVNADYVYPLENETGKFETGYQLFTYTEDGDYTIDMFNPEQSRFERRDDLYNKYAFHRYIHALYAMFSDTYSGFSYQLGLRGEYNFRQLENNLEWAAFNRHILDFFPSVHLSYALNDKSQLRASYTRRITQPELFYVEPYVVYVDYNTAQQGNPYIQPEYTNSVELGYNLSLGNNTFSTTLFHRARKDKIERVRVPYHTSVTKDSMANVGNDYSTGLEIATSLQLSRLWYLDANTSVYHYRIKNIFKVDDDEKSINYQLAINNNIDLAKNTRMRFEAYYVGPMVSTQGRVNGYYYCNLAVRQQLLNRRLTAGLSVQDIFSTAEYIQSRKGTGLESLSKIYPRTPLLTLTLSYTFNNFSRKQKTEKDDMFEGTNR